MSLYDWNKWNKTLTVMDPTENINIIPGSIAGDIFSHTNTTTSTFKDPYAAVMSRLDKLELNNKLLKLKIFGLEGKFTQEEITNIRKMIMSEDEASRTLADSIIENS